MKEEYEINLRELLLSGLLQWRWLLVAALLFAVILGGRQAAKKIVVETETTAPAASEEPMTDQEMEKAIRDYSLKKDLYEYSVAQQKKHIAYVEDLIASGEEDLEKLEEEKTWDYQLQMDPYHTYISELTVYLTVQEMNPYRSGDLITPGITDRIRAVYKHAMNAMDLSPFAEELGTSAQELGELISITADDNGATLNVRILSQDAEFGKSVLNAMKEAAGKAFQEASYYGHHEIRFSDILSRAYLDKDLCSYQVAWRQEQKELQKYIQEQMEDLTHARQTLIETMIEEPVDPLSSQAELEFDANGEVVETPLTYRRSTAKEILKQVAIGFFVGLFVCYLVVIFFYILGGKILSMDYPGRATGLRDLGTLSSPYLLRHKTPVDWFFLTRLRRLRRIDAALEERLLVIELQKVLPENGTILLDSVGKVPLSDRTVNMIRKHFPRLLFRTVNGIHDDPEVLSSAATFSGVIFALTARRSSLNDLEQELSSAGTHQLKQLGIFLSEA